MSEPFLKLDMFIFFSSHINILLSPKTRRFYVALVDKKARRRRRRDKRDDVYRDIDFYTNWSNWSHKIISQNIYFISDGARLCATILLVHQVSGSSKVKGKNQ